MSSVRPVEITELVIENVALSYLVDIKKQFLQAQKRKERAALSESDFEFRRFYQSIENLLDMIEAKTIKDQSVKRINELIEELEKLQNSDEPIVTKIKKLKAILRGAAQIIREHRWFDMPRSKERGFDLVGEFYE